VTSVLFAYKFVSDAEVNHTHPLAIDITVLASLVQTVVITITLLVFIFQFRSQEKAIRESSYQALMGRYNDYIMSGQTEDNLMLMRLFAPAANLSTEELGAIRRLMIAYGILEEAYELYEKGWIDKETWDQWDAWLIAISKHPHFADLHRASTGMFDKGYQDHVTKVLESNQPNSSRNDRVTST
jgi:hypothetical protein